MKDIIVVAGPTAVGKTQYAIELAKKLDGEIVSCDSMQLYKFMDIGSAKPTPDELSQAQHYLVDEIDPREPFSVAEYQRMATEAIRTIHEKGKTPIISGGTGLYLNSLLYEMDFGADVADDGYRKELEDYAAEHGAEALHARLAEKDPAAAERIHPNNIKKVVRAMEAVEKGGKAIKPFTEVQKENPAYRPFLIGLTRDRQELYDRINLRVEILMEQGLLQEVEGLFNMGLTEDNISMKGIGYKEIIQHLKGEYSLEEAVDKIKQNTRHYAKRQLTWFRRYDKMEWFDLSAYDSSEQALEDMLSWLKKSR